MSLTQRVDLTTQRQLCGMLQAAALLDTLDSLVFIWTEERRKPEWMSVLLPLEPSEIRRRLQKVYAVVAEHLPDPGLKNQLFMIVSEALRINQLRCLCGHKLGDTTSRHCVKCGLLNPYFDPQLFFEYTGFTIENVHEKSCQKGQHVRPSNSTGEAYCPDCGTRR